MNDAQSHTRPARLAMPFVAVLLFTAPLVWAQEKPAVAAGVEAPRLKHGDPGTDALLDRIEAVVKATKSLSARLVYTRYQGVLGDKQVRVGKIDYVAGPPGQFHIHFTHLIVNKRAEKKDQHWIFDGVWLVERHDDKKQIIKRQIVPPNAAERHKDPLAVGEGPFPIPVKFDKQKLLARFDVTLIPPAKDAEAKKDANEGDKPAAKGAAAQNQIHLRLVSKRAGRNAGPVSIDLWYDAETLTPQRATTNEGDGSSSEIKLLRAQFDAPIDKKRFSTELPKEGGWLIEVKPWKVAPRG